MNYIIWSIHNNLYPLSDDERAQFRNISRFTANSIRSLQCLQKNVKVPLAPSSSIKGFILVDILIGIPVFAK